MHSAVPIKRTTALPSKPTSELTFTLKIDLFILLPNGNLRLDAVPLFVLLARSEHCWFNRIERAILGFRLESFLKAGLEFGDFFSFISGIAHVNFQTLFSKNRNFHNNSTTVAEFVLATSHDQRGSCCHTPSHQTNLSLR